MGIFQTIGSVSNAISTVVDETAKTVSTTASAGTISAKALVVKSKGLLEDVVLEESTNRLNRLKEYKTLKADLGLNDELASLEEEFETLMARY
jgi:hypothetical protein